MLTQQLLGVVGRALAIVGVVQRHQLHASTQHVAGVDLGEHCQRAIAHVAADVGVCAAQRDRLSDHNVLGPS